MKNSLASKLLVMVFLVSSCSASSTSSSQNNQDTKVNNTVKENNIKISSADLKKVSDSGVSIANNKFGIKMFNNLLNKDKNKNVFISPLSISTALAMTYNGANGKTKEDMAKVLEISGIKPDDFNKSYKIMKDFFTSKDNDLTLLTANSLWLRKGENLKKEFVSNIDSFFDGKVTELDFADKNAPKIINDWVSEKTQDKVKDLIKNIEPSTFLYLINAVYFKGIWEKQFDKASTRDNAFMNADGIEKDVKTMFKSDDKFDLYQSDTFSAIKLYYSKDKKAYMTIFLPEKSSNLTSFYKNLDLKLLDDVNSKMENKSVNLGLPKFKIEYEKQLNETLKELGMESAFSGADFSNLSSGAGSISEVKHKTFVDVNEEGTEAAAATSVAITKSAIISNRFVVDRPFFFTITESNSNMILFMGSITDIQ